MASICIGTLVVEVGVRTVSPCAVVGISYEHPQKRFFKYDPRLGWVGRPNAHGQFAGIDYLTKVTLDEYGFRAQIPPFTEGKRNVLALGDSYAWGWGVNDSDVFAEVMNASDSSIRVYNLSAPGYGTDQSYLGLEAFLEQHPEVRFSSAVLLLFVDNDIQDVSETTRYTFPKPRFTIKNGALELTNVPVPENRLDYYETERRSAREGELGLSWRNSSHLYNRLIGVRRLLISDLENFPNVWRAPSESTARGYRLRDGLIVMRHVLAAIKALTAQHGMSFSVMLLVQRGHLWLPNLTAMLDKQGTPHDTFEIEAFPTRRRCIDPHLNPYGNRLLARAVTALLSRTLTGN